MLVTSKIARRLGLDICPGTDDLFLGPNRPHPGPACWWTIEPRQSRGTFNLRWGKVKYLIAFKFLVFAVMHEYHRFLAALLRGRGSVGKMTNIWRLRKKHLLGKTMPSENISVWETFENHLATCLIDIGDVTLEFDDGKFDLLSSMCKVLGCRTFPTSSIQLSIVDKTLGVDEVEKESFLGRIRRRHVRLLLCGNDRALVILYLKKIILELSQRCSSVTAV